MKAALVYPNSIFNPLIINTYGRAPAFLQK